MTDDKPPRSTARPPTSVATPFTRPTAARKCRATSTTAPAGIVDLLSKVRQAARRLRRDPLAAPSMFALGSDDETAAGDHVTAEARCR